MPHNPANTSCHFPLRPCICAWIGARPQADDPSIAPALLEWWDASAVTTPISSTEAWRDARVHFEQHHVTGSFPSTPEGFADLLDYANPLFAARREISFDVSHAPVDGIIDIVAPGNGTPGGAGGLPGGSPLG